MGSSYYNYGSSNIQQVDTGISGINDEAVNRKVLEDIFRDGEVDEMIKVELEFHNIMNEFNFANIYQRVNEDIARELVQEASKSEQYAYC